MKSTKAKRLLVHAAAITSLLYDKLGQEDGILGVTTTIVRGDEGESIVIGLPGQSFLNWEVLEPLAQYTVAKKLTWSIDIMDGSGDDPQHLAIDISLSK